MVEEEEEDGARAVSNGRAMWWTPLAAPHECRTCVLAARPIDGQRRTWMVVGSGRQSMGGTNNGGRLGQGLSERFS